MRILHVYKDVFPPVAGGIERHIDAIRNCLPQYEHDVLACSGTTHTTTGLPAAPRTGREVLVGEFGRPLGAPIAPSFPKWLRRLAQGAVVHLHMPNPTGELAYLLATGGHPMVATYHCDIVRQQALLPLYRPVVLACLRRARATIVSSSRLSATSPVLQAHNGPVTVVPFSVDVDRWAADGDARATTMLRTQYGQRHLLAVGRLVHYKGYEVLIDAARELAWPIVIVGDGPLRQELSARIRAQGVGDRVSLVGSVSDSRLADHYRAASALVMPSISRAEAFGMTLLEAQAAGLPVIAADVGTGVTEAFSPGVSGIAIEPRSARAIVEAVKVLASDPASASRMGAAGQRRVRSRNSQSALASELHSIYQYAAERNSPPIRRS